MEKRIKEVRDYFGLNQTDFGERIGVKQATIAGYEAGRRTPLDAVISSICREFNVNELWLREGIGEMFSPRSEEEELAAFLNRIYNSESDSVLRQIVIGMGRLSDEDWTAFETLVSKLLLGQKK